MVWRCFTISGKKEMEINEAIRDKEVRLIGADGSQLGIVPVRDALRRAEEANLDLVKIAPQAQPPVCKILDYGKFRFEQQKREKEARKNQKIVDIKEIRLSLNIDTNDFNTKVAHPLPRPRDGAHEPRPRGAQALRPGPAGRSGGKTAEVRRAQHADVPCARKGAVI